jgi:TPR repeat protein
MEYGFIFNLLLRCFIVPYLDANRCMYQLGLGLEINIPEAIKWYLKSANQGYGVASNNLAGIFMSGYDSISANPKMAESWYKKAKEQDFFHSPYAG